MGQRQAHRRPSERFGCQYSLIDRLIVDVSDMTSFNIHSNNQRICMTCFKLRSLRVSLYLIGVELVGEPFCAVRHTQVRLRESGFYLLCLFFVIVSFPTGHIYRIFTRLLFFSITYRHRHKQYLLAHQTNRKRKKPARNKDPSSLCTWAVHCGFELPSWSLLKSESK